MFMQNITKLSAADKELIERVQHRFTRMFVELRKLPYLQRLHIYIHIRLLNRMTETHLHLQKF